MKRQCFVIGPFGVAKSAIREWSDSLTNDVIKPLAKQFGYEARRSIDFARPRDITRDLVSKLLQADLVVADLTDANANVYYELAVRHAIEQPFIHVIRAGQNPPFDIKNLDVLPLPVRKKSNSVIVPDASQSKRMLEPYFSSVSDGTASYESILSGLNIGKAIRRAALELETQRAALQAESRFGQCRLPPNLQSAIFRHAAGVPLYYTHFDYQLDVVHAEGTVRYRMTVEFGQRNVSDHPQTVINRYPVQREGFEVHAAMVAGQRVDLRDPSNYTGDAMCLRHVIEPGNTAEFSVSMTKEFGERDSDLFTAYLFPADRFSFSVKNHSADTLQMWLEMLNTQSILPQRSDNVLSWRSEDPLLPNQGVRLLWRPL